MSARWSGCGQRVTCASRNQAGAHHQASAGPRQSDRRALVNLTGRQALCWASPEHSEIECKMHRNAHRCTFLGRLGVQCGSWLGHWQGGSKPIQNIPNELPPLSRPSLAGPMSPQGESQLELKLLGLVYLCEMQPALLTCSFRDTPLGAF